MDKLLKNNKKNYFSWRKTYLPLIILPLLLCLFLSFAIYVVTSRQLLQTGQMTVDKFHAQSSSIINELKIVTDSILSNDQFVSLLCEDNVSDEDVSTISRCISRQTSTSPYVQDAFVISRGHDRGYANAAVYAYESLTSLLVASNAIPEAGNRLISEEDLMEGWAMPSNNYSSPYYVSYIRNAAGERKATMVVVLTKGQLYRSLFYQNSAFCCMYNDQFILSSSLRNINGIDLTSERDISVLVGKSVKIFTTSDDKYTYLTALSKNEYYHPILVIFIAFAIYIILLLSFSLAHIYIINKREKAYFSSIVNELPQPVSENADIQTILNSVQDALEKYKEEHSAFSEQSKFRDLDRLAQGYLGESADISQLRDMNIDPDACEYYVLRFHLTESGILNPNHRNDLICIIIETSLNGFSQDRFSAVCFPQRNSDICCILNVRGNILESGFIHDSVDHVRNLLEKDYGTIFTCSVSSPVYDYKDLSSGWQETIDLFRFVHAIDSNVSYVSAEELEEQPGLLMRGEFIKQMQILSSTLVMGKYELIPQMVDEMLQDHVAPIRRDFKLAEERLQCISTLLYEAPLPAHMGEEEISSIRSRMKSVGSISGLSEAVHECFGSLAADTYDMTPVKKACDYIHDQVSNINLSVPEVAEYAGVSVQHLSKLFKADKGMTMVEYINQYRISHAQDLLAHSSLNIAGVSEQAGYANTVTFTRNFRRYVGCTPSEYRQKNR